MSQRQLAFTSIRSWACLWMAIALSEVAVYSQPAAIKHRVYLTANTVDIGKDSNFYEALKKLLAAHDEPFSLLLNGDLVSTELTQANLATDSVRIRQLLETASVLTHGKVIIIPGDRDWADSGPEGWMSVQRLEKLVKSFNLKNVKWAIKDGCPGPKVIELDDDILLVAINTQWWNHPYDKPGA